jgi:hypothetical protein
METKDINKKLAPCGLSCEKCFAFRNGKIQFYSRELKKELGNFAAHATRFSKLLEEPVFNTYPYFETQLSYFTDAECYGCRVDNCKLFKSCNVRACSKAKQVDFCFQCSEFPCLHTGFDENLHNRWIYMNSRMKEIGIEGYYKESLSASRYQ